MFSFFSDPVFWKYLSIPMVAAFVGWSTNWLAVKLLFYPVERRMGAQGIIPSKAAKMGAITTETTLAKLGRLQEVFQALEPERIAAHLVHTIEPHIEEYTEALMLKENPRVWELLPKPVKAVVYEMVRQELPNAVAEMLREVGEHVEELMDLKAMVVDQLARNPRIINKIFKACGKREFIFIVWSGLYFGFFFGLIQMVIWYFFPLWWILPLFGVIVGYATNWFALRIVFQPLNPVRIGPFVIQGLFLKRQREVAEIWCSIVTREVLTVRNLIDAMLHGPRSDRTKAMVDRHVRHVIDRMVGITKPFVQFTVGVDKYLHLKETASEKALELSERAFENSSFIEERARILQGMMQERMQALPPSEFQHLLRPAFQEEEWKLILMGSLLGLVAGVAQLFLVFGASLG